MKKFPLPPSAFLPPGPLLSDMKNYRLFLLGASGLLLPLLCLALPWYPWQLSAGLLLVAFLPGYALLVALWPQGGPLRQTEQWLIAAPVSYSLTTTLLLGLAFVRLPVTALSVAAALGSSILLFTFLAWRRTLPASSPPDPTFLPLATLFILLLAAFFRITNIHYSDYQGDEADILLRAVSLVYGQGEALVTHSKGPGEILLLNAIGALTGRFDEQTARLPFALAGAVSVGLLILLGHHLFNRWVGLAAGLLAAIDGVFVSYARTAQYQSVVLLLTVAAIYGYYRFYQSPSRSWHGLATFFLAGSCLFHFETIFLLPVAAYLTLASRPAEAGERKGGLSNLRLRPILAQVWPSALIFGLLVAVFYVPFLLNPNLESTGAYLENRISGGSSPPFNNLAHFFYYEALKYNSVYYVVFFTGLLLVLVGGTLARIQLRQKTQALSLLLLFVILLILSGVLLWLFGQPASAAWPLAGGAALFLGVVIFLPQTPLAERILWLWLAPAFWVYVFWVNRPGKHHYLFLGALTLGAAWTLTQGWQGAAATWPVLKQPVGRWLGIGLAGVLLVIFAGHTGLLFLRSDLEYILTYPAHKSRFYPTDVDYPYGTRIGFGYPFRLGWQQVGQLRRTGQLDGSWAGNDDGNAPVWYMLGARATPCYPRYVFQGEITYKGDSAFNVPFDPANFGYVPRYRLWGHDRLRLTILEFQPGPPAVVVDLYEPDFFAPPVTAADFRASMAPPAPAPERQLEPALLLGEGSELKNNVPAQYAERAGQLQGRVALLGYDVEQPYAQSGRIMPVTLYWQTQSLLNLRYKVFVHLIGQDGKTWAQADDFPVCGMSHANTWKPGQVVLDRHLLKLPADLPPGDYTLAVGMYEPDLNLRLNYFDLAGNEQGNSLTLGKLAIKQ